MFSVHRKSFPDVSAGDRIEQNPDITNRPTVAEVRTFMDSLFRGAGDYAADWHGKMEQQEWLDHKGEKVKNWKKLAASWGSGCEKRSRGMSGPDRNAGTYNANSDLSGIKAKIR